MRMICLSAAAALAFAAAPALAGQDGPAARAPAATDALAPPQGSSSAAIANPGLDPNQVICRREQEIGSRLRFRRVCVTRAQWNEWRRVDRQNVEHAQTTRIWPE